MLCSLMLEGRVGHIEKLLKCKEINYRTSDVVQDVTEKHIHVLCQIFSGEDPPPSGAVGNVLDIIRKH